MYTRVPEKKSLQSTIKIPDNYSGNAFNENNLYQSIPDIPPKSQERDVDIVSDIEEKKAENKPQIKEETAYPSPQKSRPDSLLSSLFPSKSLKNHFPFGHGIGSEEILILGIMSLIFFSDEKEPDGELIMLLALLLFAG